MPTILFTFYPSHIQYNHGIALLSSLCKARGIRVDLHLLSDSGSFVDALIGKHYDFVCGSSTTVHDAKHLLPYMDIAAEMGHEVILGGTYAPWLDAPYPVCRGDSETLPDFILNGDDKLFREPMLWDDLDSLPIIDYDIFSFIPFRRGYGAGFDTGKQLPYYSSRGCPYPCSFCLVQKQPKKLRIRYKMEEDLRQITEQYKPDSIFIGDALLPYLSERWRQSWGDFRFPFFAYIRADIPSIILQWLIDRGMQSCSFGIESGDESYRNEVLKKMLTDEQIYETVDILKKNKVNYVPFYMSGAPGETFAMRAKTYEMKDKLGGRPVVWQYESL